MRIGINAIINSVTISLFSQFVCFFACMNAITPVMENNGSHAATEPHFALESGVKFGRAGISGGKKKLSKIWI